MRAGRGFRLLFLFVRFVCEQLRIVCSFKFDIDPLKLAHRNRTRRAPIKKNCKKSLENLLSHRDCEVSHSFVMFYVFSLVDDGCWGIWDRVTSFNTLRQWGKWKCQRKTHPQNTVYYQYDQVMSWEKKCKRRNAKKHTNTRQRTKNLGKTKEI